MGGVGGVVVTGDGVLEAPCHGVHLLCRCVIEMSWCQAVKRKDHKEELAQTAWLSEHQQNKKEIK